MSPQNNTVRKTDAFHLHVLPQPTASFAGENTTKALAKIHFPEIKHCISTSDVRQQNCADHYDQDFLEDLLSLCMPKRRVQPLAAHIIRHFGSFAEAVSAPPERLREIPGMNVEVQEFLSIMHMAAIRITRGRLKKRPVLSASEEIFDYCRTALAFQREEQLWLFFLDKGRQLILDEPHSRGTVDRTQIYVREIVQRALQLNASALILVHSFPSGPPTPSNAHMEALKLMTETAAPLKIDVEDYLIVTKEGRTSLRGSA
jgi:DNA repair protein RadC